MMFYLNALVLSCQSPDNRKIIRTLATPCPERRVRILSNATGHGAPDLKDTECHKAVADHQSGRYYADHTHEFDQDIEARTTGVLERIPDRIPDYGSLVCLGSFTTVRASLDILLRIIPGTACVGHIDCNAETAR